MFPSTNTLLSLAELGLILDNFSIDSSHFLRQRCSHRHSPQSHLSFVGYVEHFLFKTYTATIPNPFSATPLHQGCPLHSYRLCWLPLTSTMTSNLLKTVSNITRPFLDLFISKGDKQSTDINHKPTDSHNNLDYITSHPPSCNNAIPFNISITAASPPKLSLSTPDDLSLQRTGLPLPRLWMVSSPVSLLYLAVCNPFSSSEQA